MRVLVVHNRYQQAGGEDAVARDESALLERHGITVERYERHNDEITDMARLGLAVDTLWSTRTTRELRLLADRFKPDLIHAHNTFPLVSPSLYQAAFRLGLPIVQTLHNFRMFCVQAMFLRDGKVCEDCLGKVPWRGVLHGCYRNSHAQSAVVATMLTFHRAIGTYRNKVSRYIALNEFCRRKYIEGGIPAERIVVKPNFIDFPAPEIRERSGFLFIGRLSEEKGIAVLASAALALVDGEIRVAGAGPEAHRLQRVKRVRMLGSLSGDEVRREMSQAVALLLPSICYETFPRTLVEAFACNLPVITSRIGSLAELVADGVTGLLFELGNARELSEKMAWALAHPQRMAEMGRAARARYENEFSAEVNFRQLMKIYADARAETARAQKRDSPHAL